MTIGGQDGLLQGDNDGVSQGLVGDCGNMVFSRVMMMGLVSDYRGQDGLLQGVDDGVSQGLQGDCGKMVFSRVVMMGMVKDYMGLVGHESALSGNWG